MLRQVDKTLKHVKLPRDPMETERSDSQASRSSGASKREEVRKRVDAMANPVYAIPQNAATIHGAFMFKD